MVHSANLVRWRSGVLLYEQDELQLGSKCHLLFSVTGIVVEEVSEFEPEQKLSFQVSEEEHSRRLSALVESSLSGGYIYEAPYSLNYVTTYELEPYWGDTRLRCRSTASFFGLMRILGLVF